MGLWHPVYVLCSTLRKHEVRQPKPQHTCPEERVSVKSSPPHAETSDSLNVFLRDAKINISWPLLSLRAPTDSWLDAKERERRESICCRRENNQPRGLWVDLVAGWILVVGQCCWTERGEGWLPLHRLSGLPWGLCVCVFVIRCSYCFCLVMAGWLSDKID